MLAVVTLALGMLLAQADCCEIYIHLGSQWIDAGRLEPSRSELPFDFISPPPDSNANQTDSNADQSQIQCDEHGRSCTTIIPSVDIPAVNGICPKDRLAYTRLDGERRCLSLPRGWRRSRIKPTNPVTFLRKDPSLDVGATLPLNNVECSIVWVRHRQRITRPYAKGENVLLTRLTLPEHNSNVSSLRRAVPIVRNAAPPEARDLPGFLGTFLPGLVTNPR